MTDQITTTLVIFGVIFRYVEWALMEDQLYTSLYISFATCSTKHKVYDMSVIGLSYLACMRIFAMHTFLCNRHMKV